jgi:hypothetical protein
MTGATFAARSHILTQFATERFFYAFRLAGALLLATLVPLLLDRRFRR